MTVLPPRLHLVTDDGVLRRPDFIEAAEAVLAVAGPAVALHLRGRATTGAALHDIGMAASAAAIRAGAWLLVNDRVDVAMAVRANGVQLGLASLPVRDVRLLLGAGAPIGYSAHSPEEAVRAVGDGADFVLMGTIHPSASHPRQPAAGLDVLEETARRAGAPTIAIGGITPERVTAAAGTGAHGVAVLGGVWRAADPARAAGEYLAAVRRAWASAGEEAR